MRLLIYGDSNTYGYDPADFYEQRYPRDKRWTSLLQAKTAGKCEIIPEGMNGRRIPDLKYEGERISRLLGILEEGDLFAVMLGTNDLFITMDPDAAAAKMRSFLVWLTGRKAAEDILVIAPPYIADSEIRDLLYQRCYRESRKMNALFRELAELFHVRFADAGSWGIDMSADLVHLSEEGHRQFADRMEEYLRTII